MVENIIWNDNFFLLSFLKLILFNNVRLSLTDSVSDRFKWGTLSGVSPLYGLQRYVRPRRVEVFSHFGHKQDIDFGHFGLKYMQGMVISSSLILNWVCFLAEATSSSLSIRPSTKAIHYLHVCLGQLCQPQPISQICTAVASTRRTEAFASVISITFVVHSHYKHS